MAIINLNDYRDVINIAEEGEDWLVCEFCLHQFKPGEKYVSDANMVYACPGAAGGLSDETCYAERKQTDDR